MGRARRRKKQRVQTPHWPSPQGGQRWLYAAGGTAVVAVGLILAVTLGFSGRPAGSSGSPGSPIDGIHCEAEMVQTHFHAHLALVQNGTTVPLPGGIGILQDRQCLYWLHTHAADGIIHIESPGTATFTLGQFFDIWGQPLSSTQAGPLRADPGAQLHVFVDGAPYPGDLRAIPLTPHELITIESGAEVPPPAFTFPSGY
jgi:hypothetical protein